MKDPTFLALTALEEAEKPAVVEKTQTSASIIASLRSTPRFREKITENDDFCRSMRSVLFDHPLQHGSDIVSQNTNYYLEQVEVSTLYMFNYFYIYAFSLSHPSELGVVQWFLNSSKSSPRMEGG